MAEEMHLRIAGTVYPCVNERGDVMCLNNRNCMRFLALALPLALLQHPRLAKLIFPVSAPYDRNTLHIGVNKDYCLSGNYVTYVFVRRLKIV
jgi:hypothetical protein